MVSAALLTGIILALVSERLYVNGGLGWDGATYALLALQFDSILTGTPFTYPASYFRYLPSAICWLALKATNSAMTTANVITAFTWMTVALLGLMAWAWCRVARAMDLSPQGTWLGWMSLFLNYSVIKFAFYYPTLTDGFALAFSMFLLCFYVLGRRLALGIVSALGFFVWPMLPLIGALLLVFPRKDISDGVRAPCKASLTGLAGIALVYAAARPLHSEMLDKVFHTLMPFSIALVFLYLFFLVAGTLGAPGLWDLHRSRNELRRVGLLTVSGLGVLAAVYYALPGIWLDLMVYIRGVVTTGIRRPAEFLVAHVLYFGPVVLLAVCNFRPTVQAVSRFGWGMAIAVCFMGYQATNPLSRQSIILLPFLVLLTTLGLERLQFRQSFLLFFAFFSLTVSKVWYQINAGLDMSIPGDQNPEFWPRFVNSTGYWMKNHDYYWQGAVVVTALFLLLLYLHTVKPAACASDPVPPPS